MEALVVCRCTHTIVAHENGRCAWAQCGCALGSYSVLVEAIDRLKVEHHSKLAGTKFTDSPELTSP